MEEIKYDKNELHVIPQGWYAIRLAQWRKEQGLGGNFGLH